MSRKMGLLIFCVLMLWNVIALAQSSSSPIQLTSIPLDTTKCATSDTQTTSSPNHLPPCVQIAWDVLQPKTVRDNYGRHVWDKYFAVNVSIFNRSQSQLIIKTLTFSLLDDPPSGQPHANVEPSLVRGSIEKGQLTGRRNVAVHIIEGIGLLATGSSGFFKAKGASATFNRSVTIFSDPFEKSIKAIFPDTTVTYLTNWDKSEIFKKGIVVEANGQGSGLIFIPFKIIFPSGDKSLPGGYDPIAIRKKIGQLGLSGEANVIQHTDTFNLR